jgi:GNAT superfamily N-acetyltransferase
VLLPESFYCLGPPSGFSRLVIAVDATIREFSQGDEEKLVQIQDDAFRGLEYRPRVKSGLPAIDAKGSLIAEKDGLVVGCIVLFKLERPGWFELRNLALKDPSLVNLGKQLVNDAVRRVDSMNPQYLKASTPAVQPYVEIYKQAGFEPVRRSLRIGWDLTGLQTGQSKIETRLLSKEFANEAADVWIEGLRPYWDYWIEEQGGPDEIKAWVRESVPKGQGWIGAFLDGKLVGLAILRPNFYGTGEARFNGAYVVPSHRSKGVGSALMDAIIREAKRENQHSMKVYTLAYLDHLAPGSILYLKSGGRIEAEYLQLQRKVGL